MKACTTSTDLQRGTTRVDSAARNSGRFETLPVAGSSRGERSAINRWHGPGDNDGFLSISS